MSIVHMPHVIHILGANIETMTIQAFHQIVAIDIISSFFDLSNQISAGVTDITLMCISHVLR